jgi:hypothetical protein
MNDVTTQLVICVWSPLNIDVDDDAIVTVLGVCRLVRISSTKWVYCTLFVTTGRRPRNVHALFRHHEKYTNLTGVLLQTALDYVVNSSIETRGVMIGACNLAEVIMLGKLGFMVGVVGPFMTLHEQITLDELLHVNSATTCVAQVASLIEIYTSRLTQTILTKPIQTHLMTMPRARLELVTNCINK